MRVVDVELGERKKEQKESLDVCRSASESAFENYQYAWQSEST